MDKEDFEFKPLTQGLGFQSKAERLKKESQLEPKAYGKPLPPAPADLFEDRPASGPGPAESSLRELLSKLPPTLDFEEDSNLDLPRLNTETLEPPKIFQPLPRELRTSSVEGLTPTRTLTPPTVHESTSVTPKKGPELRKGLDESLRKAFPKNEPAFQRTIESARVRTESVTGWRPVSTGVMAFSIDFIMVAVFSFFCVLSLMAFANIDLLNLVRDPRTSLLASLQLGILFVGVSLVYQLASRSLVGQTLGDWTFDMRLGTSEQQASWSYPLKVLWRNLVFLATGVVVLPLLSLLFRRDLGRYLSGLSLHQWRSS